MPGDDAACVNALVHLDAAASQPIQEHVKEIDVIVAGPGAELVLEIFFQVDAGAVGGAAAVGQDKSFGLETL
jgi:hypothetical protein